jgi:hypothetical protein
MTTNQIIRDSIKTAVKDLREIRRSKSCSILMGYGHTVAVKDTFSSIRQWVEGADSAYNFTATWNRRSTFWSEVGATKNLDRLRKQRPELKLEVIHHDDLRSRHEKHALFVLQSFFPLRNKA